MTSLTRTAHRRLSLTILAGLLPVLTASALPAAPAASPQRPPATAAVSADSWSWPLPHRPRPLRSGVVRPFDPPDKPWLAGHRGVDLDAGTQGSEVLAPADGVVSFRGVVVDRPVITIDHGGGIKSSFEPVESDLAVGARVRRGQPIGTLLDGHCAPRSCVHWGVRRDGEYTDPLRFLTDLRPSIPLPLNRPA
ncbi:MULTISPECIES: M23 family metallopeptidase [Arthrobacter]|uniref:M23 family metallopeptidase n=2 Tax=Arthrobacter TaxID=1663 RepID=A0ABU9KS21_9MICC|nr:M23 family metallopeptidase [Arthrobacter sp. YJM1]MDP5228230.1 M23 family metallopeptidase [Arthrobacter sp. YJM1]